MDNLRIQLDLQASGQSPNTWTTSDYSFIPKLIDNLRIQLDLQASGQSPTNYFVQKYLAKPILKWTPPSFLTT